MQIAIEGARMLPCPTGMARRLLSGMVIGPAKDFVSSTPKRKVASVGQVPDWFLNSVGVKNSGEYEFSNILYFTYFMIKANEGDILS